ncbi:MAG: PAS domain-containing protein [Pirellulales bacterium]|nr:PAS domain-containing protein [Pirellulales bacterium]
MSRTESEASLFAELAELRAQRAESEREGAMLRQADPRLGANVQSGAGWLEEASGASEGGLSTARGPEAAGEAFHAAGQLWQLILDSMGEGVAVVDEHGQFVLFNRLGREIVGLGPVTGPPEQWPERYGLYLSDQVTLYPADELPLVKAMRGETVREVQMFVRNERRPEGLWLRVTATPLRDAQERIRGGVAVFRDVTDMTRAHQALEAERWALQHMVQAQERDRRLTACEIHDGFVQEVTAALIQLEALQIPKRGAVSGLRQQVQQAIGLLRSAIEEARRLINGLRPPLLDELGLIAAVEHLVSSLRRPDGPRVELEHQVDFVRLDPLLEGAIFRMVQEALNNAVKHSGSQRLAVRIVQQHDRLQMEIIDWGHGFDATRLPADRFGLRGVMERARLFGGHVRVASAPGAGTRLYIELPLPPSPPQGQSESGPD